MVEFVLKTDARSHKVIESRPMIAEDPTCEYYLNRPSFVKAR